MINRLYITKFFTVIASCIILISCYSNQRRDNNIKVEESRPLSFTTDDEFLDFIQKTHINYMWEGAEQISGLAPKNSWMESIHRTTLM